MVSDVWYVKATYIGQKEKYIFFGGAKIVMIEEKSKQTSSWAIANHPYSLSRLVEAALLISPSNTCIRNIYYEELLFYCVKWKENELVKNKLW